ncbi:unnamed protein product, partial [Dracunculus medinensis]|uniref:WD_REPEATS_REGION domain-containing protein n=1 Tax=Dracunculus medinensis TaxID=318479 RepID=A0A0N4UJ94_DRAME
EISDVLWHPSGDYFAAAGDDRKVRLFTTSFGNKPEIKANLEGCNGAVLKLDFDADSKQVLAASADFAIRTWNIDNFRIKASLTGHGDKVSSAKFHGEGTRIISASHDRTIRLWDLHSSVRKFLSGSLAYDIVSNYRCSSMMISGHHDKKIRVWDPRSYEPVKTIELDGRITSLAISSGSLLCASRNETLSLITLHNFQILHCYSADNYRTSGDLGRCVISPNMEYCAAGSLEGQIFIWNLHSTKLEKVLHKGGHSRPVTSLSWHPKGNYLISADKGKTLCVWNS